MDVYRRYSAYNRLLARGTSLAARHTDRGLEVSPTAEPRAHLRRLTYPRIAVYAGTGTSHSWLWFVELCERMGFYDLCFPDEREVAGGTLRSVDVLLVSGGDTFAVAEALGPRGAQGLEQFIRRGGLYIGSCAGAYLPLRSSKTPLHHFNYVGARITNLTDSLPQPRRMSRKFSTAYGCRFVFHPVREEVRIRTAATAPLRAGRSITAPLYGGPGLTIGDDAEPLAFYEGFTPRTLFLVDEAIARDTLIDRVAALRARLGQGCLVLMGPHLEHPSFPEANGLVADLLFWACSRVEPLQNARESRDAPCLRAGAHTGLLRDLRRELSNSRIVAAGLETIPLHWVIGAKVYEPEKFRVFLDAMWKRVRHLERMGFTAADTGEAEEMIRIGPQVTRLLRRIKTSADCGEDTSAPARDVLTRLHVWSTRFLNTYFRTLSLARGHTRVAFKAQDTGAPGRALETRESLNVRSVV